MPTPHRPDPDTRPTWEVVAWIRDVPTRVGVRHPNLESAERSVEYLRRYIDYPDVTYEVCRSEELL